jgi:hypothetical protein
MSIDDGDDPSQYIVGLASFPGGAAEEEVLTSRLLAAIAANASKAINALQ